MKKVLNAIVSGLLIIAGLNWGFWGIWDINIINYIFGQIWLERFIYFLFAVAAIYATIAWKIYKIDLFKQVKNK
jgi:uncharacterized membrane protein YuzA (DUF378 family)